MHNYIKEPWYEILGTTVYIINFLSIMNLIFKEKRSVDTTIAWVLVLIMAPPVGCILYITFARGVSKNNMFKIKESEDRILKENIMDTQIMLNHNDNFEPDLIEYKDMIYALANSNSSNFTTNNDVEIIPDSNVFFKSLLEDLKNAKDYINIQFYIFRDDEIGNEIMDILIDKAKKGVEVRLLYDAVGSKFFSEKSIHKLKKYGVKVGVFFPSFMKIINFNLNYRNHRKIVVIDDKIGFIGGNNIGDEYLGRNSRFGYWRDTHLKITGDAVNDLNIRFILDWRYTTKEYLNLDKYFENKPISLSSPEACKNIGMQIVSSGPDSSDLDEIKYGYIKMIQKAKKYIYIQTPYFILDKTLTDTLKIACFSGVDVRIMIPSKPDHPFVYWASLSYAGELLKCGAKLYNYDYNSFLHAKTIVVDDCVCSIGTANMDIRSFELNFEINAFMYSSEVSKKQRTIFENDILKSKEITLDMYNSRSRYMRVKESISRLLSPIL